MGTHSDPIFKQIYCVTWLVKKPGGSKPSVQEWNKRKRMVLPLHHIEVTGELILRELVRTCDEVKTGVEL